MDDPIPTAHRSSRVAEGVLTLWRGCYDDARLIEAPWGDGDALALVHALDFGGSAKRDRRHRRRRRRHQKDGHAKQSSDDDDSDDDDDKKGSRSDGGSEDDEGDSDGDEQGVTLNGIAVRSPLAAATGTYTAERVDDGGRRPWVHLYRACVPDLPGAHGRRSSAQVYVKALEAAGLDVAASASSLRASPGRSAVACMRRCALSPIRMWASIRSSLRVARSWPWVLPSAPCVAVRQRSLPPPTPSPTPSTTKSTACAIAF